MKRGAENLKTQKSQDIAIDNGFLKKYSSALLSVSKTLQKEKPDYILALSRKGPRLLEMLRLSGWLEDIPIISEKAIDFIPPEELKGKKILVFDDIIISGTTISNLLSNIAKKYDIEKNLVCMAIDKDTLALKKDTHGNYYIELPNGERVVVDYKLALSKDERFIFCNEIVRSFAFLNKPYDIDYPIFYTSINSEVMSSLLTQLKPDKAYNLTTTYQYNNGYCRYTFLPVQEVIINNLFDNISQNSYLRPQICKVRIYYNEENDEMALVPMVTFEANGKLFEEERIFADYTYYNILIDRARDLINQSRDYIDSKDVRRPLYRLIWYIVNYLYGLSFNLRNLTEKDGVLSFAPSQILHHQDLVYLFGPSLTQIILDFLNSCYTQTIQELKDSFNVKIDSSDYERQVSESRLDEKREKLYEDIKNYLVEHIRVNDALTYQMAAIFEGLYYSKEIQTQEEARKNGIKEDYYKRLERGFNYDQIKCILHRHGAFSQYSTDNEIDLKISLALDFLVDAGIQIPIFYYERDGYFERAYRYGEDALSAKQYGYLIASAIKHLFSYMKKDDKETFPQITFEKIGVILREKILETGVVDILETKIGDRDRYLKIAPDFCTHGKILQINDEAYGELGEKRYMFTEWCEREGIVQSVPTGVSYSDKYLNNLIFDDGSTLKLISKDKIGIFENLAVLLYHIDQRIDRRGKSDYLIALTACNDYRSYFEAVREDLRLFFKGKDYNFSLVLKYLKEALEDEENRTQITNSAREVVGKSVSVAHETRHKKNLFADMDNILKTVEDYFEGNIDLRPTYSEKLSFYIDNIKRIHDAQEPMQIKNFKTKIDALGDLSINLSGITKNLIGTKTFHGMIYKIFNHRKTNAGKIHKTDLDIIKSRINDLIGSVKSWNEYLKINAEIDFNGILIDQIPRINYDKILSLFSNYDAKECMRLIQILLPKLNDCYVPLEKIYMENYSQKNWENDNAEINLLSQRYPELLPKEEDLEETSYIYLISYDIKDSSGKENPENKKNSPIVKKLINEKLKSLQERVNDGRFNLEEQDSKNIYVNEAENVKKYLATIMNTTAGYQMFLRLGVSSIQDTGKPIYVKKNTKMIDIIQNTHNHTLVNRLCTFQKERGHYHRLTISKEVMYEVWGNDDEFTVGNPRYIEWEIPQIGEKSREHYVYFPEISKNIPFYIAKCSMENKKQPTLYDFT